MVRGMCAAHPLLNSLCSGVKRIQKTLGLIYPADTNRHNHRWLQSLVNNFTVIVSYSAGCCVGNQPCHNTSPGDCAEEALADVSRGAAALQAGQHDGWLLGGHSPQSYPEDIWGQGPRHHWRAQEEPSCFCPHSAEKVNSLILSSYLPLVRDSQLFIFYKNCFRHT